MFRAILPTLLFALITTGLAHSDEKPNPKAEPEGTPLEIKVTGKTKYAFDVGGLTTDEFKKKVNEEAKAGRWPTLVPTVDLSVEVKNTSGKAVQMWVSGDPVVLTLTLKGKGAINANPSLALTEEFRVPRAVEIAAGKTHVFQVRSLVSGYRGVTQWALWSEPGDYELTATLKTGVNPAPKGANADQDGFAKVTLTSAPLKLTVEKK